MKTIIISPFSRPLRNGGVNPKNNPYWPELIELLRKEGYRTIQVGTGNEMHLPADEVKFDPSLSELEALLKSTDLWISVDNFFGHFAAYHKKPGIVLWGQSDPLIFGYPTNHNLLKSRMYLRQDQHGIWEAAKCIDVAFVSPNRVLAEVQKF